VPIPDLNSFHSAPIRLPRSQTFSLLISCQTNASVHRVRARASSSDAISHDLGGGWGLEFPHTSSALDQRNIQLAGLSLQHAPTPVFHRLPLLHDVPLQCHLALRFNDSARETIAAPCTLPHSLSKCRWEDSGGGATIQSRDGETVSFRSGVKICSESRKCLGALSFPLSLNVLGLERSMLPLLAAFCFWNFYIPSTMVLLFSFTQNWCYHNHLSRPLARKVWTSV